MFISWLVFASQVGKKKEKTKCFKSNQVQQVDVRKHDQK